mgnify:CR=1 FL=1
MRLATVALNALQIRIIRCLPRSKGMTAFASKIFCISRAAIRDFYDTSGTRYSSPPRFARCQFDPALNGLSAALQEVDEMMGTADGEANPIHPNTPRFQEREFTPDWVFNDLALRRFLLHTFPRLQTDERHRMWARRWAALLYMYYRLHLPANEIAERLGMKLNTVEVSILRIRKRGDAFFCKSLTNARTDRN